MLAESVQHGITSDADFYLDACSMSLKGGSA
jgi:hypothetical protein